MELFGVVIMSRSGFKRLIDQKDAEAQAQKQKELDDRTKITAAEFKSILDRCIKAEVRAAELAAKRRF
jgi:hypothetical protein